MIEALFCGLVASMAFIGFISVIYYILLHIFKSSDCASYLICIPKQMKRDDFDNLYYLLHIKSIIFGDLFFNKIYLIDDNLEQNFKIYISELCECSDVIICTVIENLLPLLKRED